MSTVYDPTGDAFGDNPAQMPGIPAGTITSVPVPRSYRVTPQFPPNSLPTPGVVYWSVRTQLRDSAGMVISESPESPLFQFLLDSEKAVLIPSSAGPGGETWEPLLQKNPLVPSKAFRLLSVLPFPGFVNQDSMPQAE